MSILHLFKISYYFDSYAGGVFPGIWVVLGLAIILLAASVWMKRKSEKWSFERREITARITGPVFVASWTMLLWLFFRYEQIVYLSWRLWPALIFIYLVVSGVMLYRWIRFELPKRKAKALTGDDTKQHYLRRFSGQGRAGGSKKK